MAGGKGGSTTTTVEVPEYIEEAAKRNLARADTISQIGYVPYYGPDVAAFTPTQEAAFQNVAGQAGAFGLTTPAGGVMAGMPTPQEFAGGIRGYSSAPMYEQALGELATRRPAQFNLIESLFINPVTGQVGANVGSPVAPVIDATAPMIDTTSPVISGVGGGGFGAGGGGTDYVNIGGGQIAVGGDVYDTAGDPFGELTDQQLQDLADVGLVGTVDYGLEDGTTFVPAGSDMTEVEALRDVIGQTSDIDLARLQERADLIAAEAAGSDQSIQDIGLGLDAARDQVYGVTAGGTATSRTGMQVADAYDPRSEYFGQPTATDITATQAEDTFGTDLYRSLTDPYYDPEGTVLSRALGGLFDSTAPAPQIVPDNQSVGQERKEQEVLNLASQIGAQGVLDVATNLDANQIKALGAGTLTSSEVAEQVQAAPTVQLVTQKGLREGTVTSSGDRHKDNRKIIQQAANEGNLGAVVDAFAQEYMTGGKKISDFQEKTGISPTILQDLEKLAKAKGY